jgi:hypothetical protein
MKYFVLSLIIVYSAPLFAKCNYGETIDLRVREKSILNRLPIQNQGTYGICYAYAGSFLTDFVRNKTQLSAKRISPLHAGLIGTLDADSDSEEGGDVCEVIEGLSKVGKACSEDQVLKESRYQAVGVYFHQNVVQDVFMPFILSKETFKKVPINSFDKRANLTKAQISYLTRFDRFYTKLKNHLATKQFSGNFVPSAKDVFNYAQSIHIANTYHKLATGFTKLLVEKNCTSKITIPPLKCTKETRTYGNNTLIETIDKTLSETKPAAIHYCSVVLTNAKASGLDGIGNKKSNCLPHASVIIGKRSRAGSCEYLIRNSWGTNQRYAHVTDKGDIWIKEDLLRKNLYEVMTVD